MVQAHRQPGRGDFKAGTRHAGGVVALDQRVVVGQEEECVHTRLRTGFYRGPDGSGVVA
ncbi:hypothetical protein D3C73_1557900 [compost metagenome]